MCQENDTRDRAAAQKCRRSRKHNETSGLNSMLASFHISHNESTFSYSQSNFKTPSKTPNKQSKTPGKTVNHTPRKDDGADRFIPNRSAMNNDMTHYLLTQANKDGEGHDNLNSQTLSEALNCDLKRRILCFNDKAPNVPEGRVNPHKVLYSSSKVPASAKRTTRYIANQPERILDAPEVRNNFYLQLLDWSSKNVLAVALDRDLYLWNASSGAITNLLQLPEDDHICSVAWVNNSNNLAIGTSTGSVLVWDAEKAKQLRKMNGHDSRVGTMSWNSYLLSTGSRTGQIIHHDVRIPKHRVSLLQGHDHEVCGLKWSPNGDYLASGGNDNVVNVWSNNLTNSKPVYTFNAHQGAVKAIGWCPWKPNLLATGGGSADRHIRVWNINNGTQLYSVDTESQVSAVLWSKEYHELISAHGYANNEIIIWKYPGLEKVTELTGHSARVLGLAMSADGSVVVSLSADETLRFWECFPVDSTKKKEAEVKAFKETLSNNPMRVSIR